MKRDERLSSAGRGDEFHFEIFRCIDFDDSTDVTSLEAMDCQIFSQDHRIE